MASTPSNTIDIPGPIGPASVEYKREETRAKIAYALLGIFALEVIAALTTFVFPHQLGLDANGLASAKDILSVVFSPTVALVGSAVGFYFGTVRNKSEVE